MTLVELVVAVHDALDAAGVGHAFGGALALAHIGEPRGTVDVDVNVFTGMDGLDATLLALDTIGLAPEADPDTWMPAAGIRCRSSAHPFPVDVFPPIDDRYVEVAARVVEHPFGTERQLLPFLSPEDLAVFKLSFGRPKDWVDLRSIAEACPDLDVDLVEDLVVGLRGPSMHPRVVRLRTLLARPTE